MTYPESDNGGDDSLRRQFEQMFQQAWPEGMPSHDAVEPPQQLEIARRAAAAVHDEFIDDATHVAYLDISPGGAAKIQIQLHQFPIGWQGSGPAASHAYEVGHYDAASQDWHIYPEIVHPSERDAFVLSLTPAITRQRALGEFEDLGMEAGTQFIDLHHPLTIRARQLSAQLLAGVGDARQVDPRQFFIPADSRVGSDIGRRAVADDQSSYYLSIHARLKDKLAIPDGTLVQVLSIVCDGALVYEGDRYIGRGTYTLDIAEQDVAGGSEWAPRAAVFAPHTLEIWEEHIRFAPDMLKSIAAENAHFSPAWCAVVRYPDAEPEF